jgi:hypothetical protein
MLATAGETDNSASRAGSGRSLMTVNRREARKPATRQRSEPL